MKVFFLLALSLFCSLSASINAQDLSISFATPTNASVCGPTESATVMVTNNGTETATNVTGAFTNPAEISILEVQAPATGTPASLMLGNIAAGETITFDIVFQARCGARTLNPATFSFQLALDSDEGATANETSGSVEVIFADLSLPPPTNPAILGVYVGLEESVNTQVVNGSFGMVTEFSYCVSNNLPNLQLNGILIGGNDITAAGTAFVNGNYNCYTVTTADLMAVGLGNTLDQLETVPVEEVWEVIGCTNDPEDIRRRVQYGCQGETDCQMKPDGDFQSTPVTYETLFPNIDITNVSATRPACYMDEPTMATVRLTNNGTAPGDSIGFRIATDNSNGMTIDLASVVITNEQTGMAVPAANYTTSNQRNGQTCQGGGVTRIDYRLDEFILDIGESITVSYNVEASCDCNDCNIRNKYFSNVQIRDYIDLCSNLQSDRGSVTPNGRYDAFMQGLPKDRPTSTMARATR